jgi:hypothetical protein
LISRQHRKWAKRLTERQMSVFARATGKMEFRFFLMLELPNAHLKAGLTGAVYETLAGTNLHLA